MVQIFPAFSRIRTDYGEIRSISLYSVQMRENTGNMRTRITPNTDTFYAVTLIAFTRAHYYVMTAPLRNFIA